MQSKNHVQSRAMWLAIALVITFAAQAIPHVLALRMLQEGGTRSSYEPVRDLILLAIGSCLALSAPSRSGLRLGRIREHWRGVLLVCGVPILLTALVYPSLSEHPFAACSWSVWAISPLAQDLVFIGFLYGQLDFVFPGNVHSRLPLGKGLVLTAACFALWHLPMYPAAVSGAYLVFQLAYSAGGLILTGLSRQWTGSILYAVVSHTAVNSIALFSG